MKNKLKSKTIIFLFSLLTSFTLASCSDWTDVEALKIEDPGIENQNPELYAEYLENLKIYKSSHHKTVYAWFDNSVKTPFNRAQHIDNIPDSVDVVILMHPDNLNSREMKEKESIRNSKATKTIFTLSYDLIKLKYDNKLAEQEETNIEPEDFITFLADTLKYSLNMVDKYDYDGIAISYNGKGILHMTDPEKEIYILNENTFINTIQNWSEAHKDKIIVFEGKPQNMVNNTILSSCRHIIISGIEATNANKLSYNILTACVDGVPTDRFIVTAPSTSLDQSDKKTGYWTDGSLAVTSSATWAAASYTDFTISGLGIHNVNNDYFNARKVYQYTREAIYILNPSLKAK